MIISNTQILSATPGMTKNNKVKWDISLANGRTYTAWELEKYQKALAHIGMPSVDVEIVQKGQWENFGDVRPAGGVAGAQAAANIQYGHVPPNTSPVATFDAKDERIGKMNASSTAFAFIAALAAAGLDEPDQLERLVGAALYLSEAIYAKNHNLPVPAPKQPATPTTVQEQVNAVVGSEAVTTVQW